VAGNLKSFESSRLARHDRDARWTTLATFITPADGATQTRSTREVSIGRAEALAPLSIFLLTSTCTCIKQPRETAT